MTRMHAFEDVTVGEFRLDDDGFLRADARLARTGIQIYSRDEVPGATSDIVRVYRPEEEVFDAEAMASLRLAPLTIGHPDDFVTARDEDAVVGWTGDDVRRDGDFVRARIVVTRQVGRDLIARGVRQLSVGYTADIEMRSGLTPRGERFDAVQRRIRANHVAIVPEGRCGSGCRIGDGAPKCGCDECAGRPEMKTNPTMIDGVPVETVEEAARIIAAKDKQLSATRDKLLQLEKDVERSMERHAAALKSRDAEIAELKGKMSDEAIGAEALKLVATWAQAAPILPSTYAFDKKTRQDVMRDVLIRMTQDKDIVKDKQPGEIESMFALAMSRPQLADRSLGGLFTRATQSDRRDEYGSHLSTAYLAPAAQK